MWHPQGWAGLAWGLTLLPASCLLAQRPRNRTIPDSMSQVAACCALQWWRGAPAGSTRFSRMDDAARVIVLAVFQGSGLLFALLGFPLYRRWVRPNSFYGFRTKKTLRDRETWYEVNRTGGLWFALTGVATAAAASLNSLLGTETVTAAWINIGVCVAGLLVTMIQVFKSLAAHE